MSQYHTRMNREGAPSGQDSQIIIPTARPPTEWPTRNTLRLLT